MFEDEKTKVNYIDTIYDKNRTPQTNYPSQLISYLKNEFSLNKGSKLLELGVVGEISYMSSKILVLIVTELIGKSLNFMMTTI